MRGGPAAALRGALAVASVAVLVTIGLMSVTAAASAPSVKSRLLTVSDLPAGWHSHPSTATQLDRSGTPCLRSVDTRTAARKATASFVQGSGLPSLAEALTSGTAAQFHKAVDVLTQCHRLSLLIGSEHVKATIAGISLPVPGAASHAFKLALTATDAPIRADIVLFRVDGIIGETLYLAVGTPTHVTAEALTEEAVSKVKGHAVSPPRTVSVVSSPVEIVHTTMGKVGYREVGSGPPLVLIMGFAGTMETWDPRFVDALAHDHEIVIFDNAGIGDSQSLASPPTIDEMAEQTSALIRALGLGRPDVLGWSMGTMVAQALAVLHPAQVNRLVLCAGYPGTGSVEPTQRAISDLKSGTPSKVLSALFPANRRAGATGYELSVSAWPKSPGAPAAVVSAQGTAITQWWRGKDRAGRRTSTISAPTLALDGRLDLLDPQENTHRLRRLIRGSEVSFYPDAGHAFLFQDRTAVVRKIEAFLGH